MALDLRGLTVLVGQNGSGKSTLIEVCRLLGRLPSTEFGTELMSIHGGPAVLARDRSRPVEFGCTVSGELGYSAAISQVGSNPGFDSELVTRKGNILLGRSGTEVHVGAPLVRGATPRPRQIDGVRSAILQALPTEYPDEGRRLGRVLEAIEVHLPLDTLARWGGRSIGRQERGMREPQQLSNATRLDLLGRNLANAWHHLKNATDDDHWRDTIDTVRLGLGLDLSSVVLQNYGPGDIGLALRFRGTDQTIDASQLSDGMLAWLAFVAMVRLPHQGGLLAIDEPELHFEPRLLVRVVGLLEEHAESRPVLVATHSDRLLDALAEPAGSVVACVLDDTRSTRLMRPDPAALSEWLEQFSGYGALRAAGHDRAVLRASDG